MDLTIKRAVISTLCYADIFDYPLTVEEIRYWLIKKGNIKERQVLSVVKQVGLCKGSFWSLGKSGSWDTSRMKRAMWSREKRRIAIQASSYLQLVPTIQLVGITGALAMNNTQQHDDIDFLCITSQNCLWVSRMIATIIIDLLGVRRHPGQTHVENKICLNMFMTEVSMGLIGRERDLFSAHEVLQMQPLWERNGMYGKFLQVNSWVKTFLPNAWREKFKGQSSKVKVQKEVKLFEKTIIRLIRVLENPAKKFQLWYMKKRRTREFISDGVLRFHPNDARIWVKNAFRMRLRRYNLPLDKIFNDR